MQICYVIFYFKNFEIIVITDDNIANLISARYIHTKEVAWVISGGGAKATSFIGKKPAEKFTPDYFNQTTAGFLSCFDK